jgi:hypothetical protein
MGSVLFVASLGVAIAFAVAASRWMGGSRPQRVFVAVLALGLHLGTAAQLVSLVQRYEPVSFLAVQVLLLVLAVVGAARRARVAAGPPSELEERSDPDAVVLALRAVIILLLGLSLAHQAILPVSGIDERTYHASRAAYWMQNRSIFWYETHNDRQVVFPFGGDLFFAWGVLFTKSELVGRLLFWLGFPLGVFQAGLVCRAAGVGRRAAQAAALLLAATPVALNLSVSLKSDLWTAVYGLAATGILLGKPEGTGARRAFLVGIGVALAINAKTTMLAITPGAALVALFCKDLRCVRHRGVALAAGLLLGTAASGLALTLAQNAVHRGHPLGNEAMLRIVRPEGGDSTALTHLVRVPLVLAELPEVPSETLRVWLEARMQRFGDAIGAFRQLPKEENARWPGSFMYRLRPTGVRYSLGGMLWLPALAGGVFVLMRSAPRAWKDGEVDPRAAMALLALPLFFGVVVLIRWMGGGPERFWYPAYALAVPLIVCVAAPLCRRWATVGAAAMVLLAWLSAASLRQEMQELDEVVRRPPALAQLEAPFHEALRQIPPGSTILLVGHQGIRDYYMFAPREGFANRVIPWGAAAFTEKRMQMMIQEHTPTHVLMEGEWAGFFGHAMSLGPVKRWLSENPEFRRVEVPEPVTMFERVGVRE